MNRLFARVLFFPCGAPRSGGGVRPRATARGEGAPLPPLPPLSTRAFRGGIFRRRLECPASPVRETAFVAAPRVTSLLRPGSFPFDNLSLPYAEKGVHVDGLSKLTAFDISRRVPGGTSLLSRFCSSYGLGYGWAYDDALRFSVRHLLSGTASSSLPVCTLHVYQHESSVGPA